MTIHLLAILLPKPGRVARVEQLAKDAAAYVQQNEPGTLKYQWFRSGTPEQPKIVVWEVYSDEAAFEVHKTSPMMAKFVQAEQEESNLTAPIEILPLEHFEGFASREVAKI
ncbi:hypothetical protein N657DRAFT_650953 [Parathielavia appendiculata]|uniref:ABM domain-containing protein n=1 Tax=Parathielavia appendiculata TaxID=2587402 RepID=A0AAN6YYE0_9PEZI|nr:hypothetical protein N657DRAFT_650953 [Parathielavia appendiculata]